MVGRVSRRIRWMRATTGDDGFTLVEIMVTIVIFALLMSGVLAMLNTALGTDRSNRMRVIASNLASRQIEIARNMDTEDIPDGETCSPGSTPPSCLMTVGSDTFFVTQSAVAVRGSETSSACDAPSGEEKLNYKRITVIVEWSNMGAVQPVRSDTLRTFPVNGTDASKANISVKVLDSNSRPLAHQNIQLTSSGPTLSQTTGYDGCVVFTNLTRDQEYTAKVSTPGYVDLNGAATLSSKPISPDPGPQTQVYSVTLGPYDQASSLALTVTPADPSYPVPPGFLASMPVTLGSTTLWASTSYSKPFLNCGSTGADPNACASGTPRVINNLFPLPYSAWAGACSDSDPGASDRPPQIVLSPGEQGTGSLRTQALAVTTRTTTGAVKPNQDVYAIPVDLGTPPLPSCTASGAVPLGKSDGSGVLSVSMPWGTWKLSQTSTAGTGAPAVTLNADSPLPTNATVRG